MRNFRGFLLREGEFVSDSELSGHATGSDDGVGDSSDDDLSSDFKEEVHNESDSEDSNGPGYYEWDSYTDAVESYNKYLLSQSPLTEGSLSSDGLDSHEGSEKKTDVGPDVKKVEDVVKSSGAPEEKEKSKEGTQGDSKEVAKDEVENK